MLDFTPEVYMKKRLVFTVFAIVLLFSFGACSKEAKTLQTPETASTEEPTIAAMQSADAPKLTVGMMSAVDAAPFYLAEQRGYYNDAGVEVELILFTNGQHRQTALQTGQVDGAMTDLVALITQTASDFRLTGTVSTDGHFPLLSQEKLQDKEAVTAGTMEISVTNYLLEQYLGKSHIVEKVYINEIPARLEAVASGQLDTGIFPEPFASIGQMRGLEKTIFEGIPAESLNIIAFTEDALKDKSTQISGFHRAYAQAVKDLQENPDLAREVLLTVIPNLPESIRDSIHIPTYHTPRLPSSAFTQEIIDWTADITHETYEITTDDLYDYRFTQAD
jgi:NitT/TauT family transport system substrate-binding protein